MKLKFLAMYFLLANVPTVFGEGNLNVQGISILHFESGQAFISAGPKNIKQIRHILVLGIKIAVDNIVNARTTLTAELKRPFAPSFIVVHPDLSIAIEADHRFVEVYDPTHPDAQKSGDRAGYVRYPVVNVEELQNEIERMTDLLEEIE